VEAAVGKGGSTDYVYYTDYESADPNNVQAYPSGTTTPCGGSGYTNALYWWATPDSRSSSNCTEITFVAGDTLAGAVFSNDSVLSSGVRRSPVASRRPTRSAAPRPRRSQPGNYCLRKSTGGSYSTANFSGIKPQYSRPLYLGDTSAAFATYPGCHYFGSTRIIFNADGTMNVWSKTLNNGGTAPLAIAPPGGSAPSCGTTTDLNSAGGAVVSVPDNMVIYVAGDVSGTTHARCDAGQIGGPGSSTLPLGTYTKALAAAKPTGNNQSYTYDQTMTETNKFCQEGNLYAQGVVKGR